jgi:hypothetical protein
MLSEKYLASVDLILGHRARNCVYLNCSDIFGRFYYMSLNMFMNIPVTVQPSPTFRGYEVSLLLPGCLK